MIEQIISYLGRPIQDKELREFIEKNSFTKIKKEQISSSSVNQSFWIQGKKNGISLLFATELNHPNFPLVSAKKNKYISYFVRYYIPRLEIINFEREYNKDTNYDFPFGINFDLTFKEITNLLGEPTTISSNITPSWLREDGRESFYRWKKSVTTNASISVEFWNDEKSDGGYISEIRISVDSDIVLLHLYDNLKKETIKLILKSAAAHYLTPKLFFLQWAIRNNHFKITEDNKEGVIELNQGKLSIEDFCDRYIKRSYLTAEDFTSVSEFARKYLNNLSGYNIYFTEDYESVFIKNVSYEEEEKILNKIDLSLENYKKVEAFINQRLFEFNKHEFMKSKKLL